MKLAPTLATALAAVALAAAACGGDSKSTGSTPTIPVAPTSTPGSAPTAAGTGVAVGTAQTATGTVAPDCETVVPTREIAQLVGSSLTVLPGAPARTGPATQIVCRYLVGAGASADKTIIVVVAGYADEATAASQDALGRQAIEQQGGSFTKITGVGDEAYSFVFPTLAGVSARLGTHTLSFGIGKGLRQPAQDAVTVLAQRILETAGR